MRLAGSKFLCGGIDNFARVCYNKESAENSIKNCRNNRQSFGRLAEWSMASVLKTEDLQGSGGSNPSPSAMIRDKKDVAPKNLGFTEVFPIYWGKVALF